MCDHGNLGDCRSESVVYEIKCGVCEEGRGKEEGEEGRGKGEGKRRVYIGETGKSGWERAAQHWRAWAAKSPKSCLHKHDVNEHGGRLKKTDMKMCILSKPRRALQHQVEEAVRILEEEPESLLNS